MQKQEALTERLKSKDELGSDIKTAYNLSESPTLKAIQNYLKEWSKQDSTLLREVA
jgi:hypothetical protein